MSSQTIARMVDWVEHHLTLQPTLADLSKHVGYSPYYCSAQFRERLGITLKQYISMRRVSLAAVDVCATDMRLLDIALKYGYSSQEAFTRSFVRAFGHTPKQCRKEGLALPLYGRPVISSPILNGGRKGTPDYIRGLQRKEPNDAR